jgi:predicted ArsR family transcriptional regulator
VSEDFVAAVTGIGALVEPARRALYLYASAQPGPVSREQAAEACGLLEVEYRRLSGRSGPGAGRPAKLYRRSDRQVAVSLPERRYDLAGEVLAAGIEEAARTRLPVQEAVVGAAAARGRAIAVAAAGGDGPDRTDLDRTDLDRTADVLGDQGYEPQVEADTLCLTNCPFDRLARDHVELVCGMNLGLVTGVLDGLGCAALEAVLEPEPGLCCVKVRRG